MRLEICDVCKKRKAVGRIKISLREIGGSHLVICRNIKNTAYCLECAEKDIIKITKEFTQK